MAHTSWASLFARLVGKHKYFCRNRDHVMDLRLHSVTIKSAPGSSHRRHTDKTSPKQTHREGEEVLYVVLFHHVYLDVCSHGDMGVAREQQLEGPERPGDCESCRGMKSLESRRTRRINTEEASKCSNKSLCVRDEGSH